MNDLPDRVSKTPDAQIVTRLREASFSRGLLFETGGHFNNVIRFIPPLIINKKIIDNALKIFEAAHEFVMRTDFKAEAEAALVIGH